MSIIEQMYKDHRNLVEENRLLRRENKELQERCAELQEYFDETTKPNPEFYKSMIELVKMIPSKDF